jgi:hypothetical protein
MGDGFIPADLVSEDIKPMWRQFFEHGTLVQFDHRILVRDVFARDLIMCDSR